MSVPFGMVPAHPVGSVALASLTTSWRGGIRVTAVLKATFAFAPGGGEMPLVTPVDIVPRDVHFDDAPTRSVRQGSDLSPALEKAEVLFRGHAHAGAMGPGVPITQSVVRLAVAGDRGIVLDKRLVVIGDRAGPGSAPAPFTKMRIGYERAAGGPDDPHNPIGVGFTGGLPNIVYPEPARASEPAGFGPVAASWRCRKELLRGREPFAFDKGPVALPDDLDWSYFQSAPADQRLAELPEGAWILLEGLHPEHVSLRMRLPHLAASARLYASGREGATIALRADTLFIDGEAQRCTVTWRGSFPLSGASALPELVMVAAGVHPPGQPLAWPPAPPPPRARAASSHPNLGATVGIDLAAIQVSPLPFQAAPARPDDTMDEPPSPLAEVLPFHAASSPGGERAAPAAAIAGAPWSGVPVARPVLEEPDDGGTMLIRAPGGVAPPPPAPRPPSDVPPPALVVPALVVAPAPPPVVVAPAVEAPAPPPIVARPTPPPAPPAPAAAPAPAPPPRVVEADRQASETAGRTAAPPAPPPPRPARPQAPPPPQPRPVEPVPHVPVPSAGSRKAYTKFGSDDD